MEQKPEESKNQNFKVNLQSLIDKAKESSLKESYLQLLNKKYFRIGISVVIADNNQPDCSIEFLLCVFQNNSNVKVSQFEGALDITKKLKKKDYIITHRDDGWIICEKKVTQENVEADYIFLMDLLNQFKDFENDK